MGLGLPLKVFNRFASWRRDEISRRLLAYLQPLPSDTCLELGGPTNGLTEAVERFESFLILNKDREFLLQSDALFTRPLDQILGDATEGPFNDASVDFVVSNALLEHIPPERRARWAREVIRIGRKGYFVSTPNFWFPFEPHYRMPFFQFLPESVKRGITRRVRIGWVYKDSYEPIALATKRDLRRLFPQANIASISFTRTLPETIIAWQRFDGRSS